MDRYAEQLNLLAIFDYVVGGLAALFSFSPLFYSVSAGFTLRRRASGAELFLAGVTMGTCILIAGRSAVSSQGLFVRAGDRLHGMSLLRSGRFLESFIVAPLRESVRELFEHTQTAPPYNGDHVLDLRAGDIDSRVLTVHGAAR
jgi:hypothetical protein